MMILPPKPLQRRAAGFTLMELLVVIAIILVLAAITYPVIGTINQNKNKVFAVTAMKRLSEAGSAYQGQHDGVFPSEGKAGDDWGSAADPANADVWYNALPKLMGMKTVGEFAHSKQEFYTKANPIFLPGADYPKSDKKLVKPLFAIAMNTKLQRRTDPADKKSKKTQVRFGSIANPSRTVLFLENGLPGEKDISLKVQPKYDGAPKGSAKSFVGRYSGQGTLGFADGHVETVEAKDLLTESGAFYFPPTDIIWCQTPDENPN